MISKDGFNTSNYVIKSVALLRGKDNDLFTVFVSLNNVCYLNRRYEYVCSVLKGDCSDLDSYDEILNSENYIESFAISQFRRKYIKEEYLGKCNKDYILKIEKGSSSFLNRKDHTVSFDSLVEEEIKVEDIEYKAVRVDTLSEESFTVITHEGIQKMAKSRVAIPDSILKACILSYLEFYKYMYDERFSVFNSSDRLKDEYLDKVIYTNGLPTILVPAYYIIPKDDENTLVDSYVQGFKLMSLFIDVAILVYQEGVLVIDLDDYSNYVWLFPDERNTKGFKDIYDDPEDYPFESYEEYLNNGFKITKSKFKDVTLTVSDGEYSIDLNIGILLMQMFFYTLVDSEDYLKS